MALFVTTFRNLSALFCGLLVGCIFSRISLLLLHADNSTVRHCHSDSLWSSAVNIVRSSNAYNNNSQRWTTKNRPRFLATELATRERLLIASLSSPDGLSSFGFALANATKPIQAAILYYVGKEVPTNRRDVVSLSEPSPLSMLESVARNKADGFDFYLLVPETSYVNGFALDKLLATMTAGDHLLLGFAVPGRQCTFESGILFSNSALKALAPRLVHCTLLNKPNTGKYPYSIEECIRDYSDILQCTVEWKGRPLLSAKFDENGDHRDNYSNDILTVTRATSLEQHRRLNALFADYELSLLKEQLDLLSSEIMELHSANNETIALPLGLAEPWKSVKRHDLLLWDFFDGQNMFDVSNQWNVAPLSPSERSDINSVTAYAVRWLQSNRKTEGLQFRKLLSGYRRFDPVRGMEYTVDLEFNDAAGRLSTRRIYLLRSLGKATILPVPFVTEARSVTLVLPVTVDDIEAATEFLAQFRKTYLETGENCKLVALLLLKHDGAEYALFRPIMQTLNVWRLKLRSAGRSEHVVYFTLKVQRHSLQSVLDFFVQRLRQPELIFLVSPWLEVNTEMLNRVRLSTIEKFQVFFPVPFTRYSTAFAPTVAANKEPKLSFNINRDSGHFDLLSFELASFYSSDYLRARTLLTSKNHLFYLFCTAGQVHVLRVVDPAFRLRHPNRHCQSRSDSVERDECMVQENESLGSKAQLASFLFSRS